MDKRALQIALGVTPDGILGKASFTALFMRCGAKRAMAAELAICAAVHFDGAGLLDNPLRLAHFLAQLMHESCSFVYMEEIASGHAYEGRKDLGNVQTGDGIRYKGRGPIQLTGRGNYRLYGERLGIDLESHPEIVAFPSIGLRCGIEFWAVNKLNALADRDDLLTITRKINGGTNGLASRKSQLAKVKKWLPS